MSLIKCKECQNEISDKAESCPKCGAPVTRVIGENEERCGHCMTVVNKGATICPGCGARKGYPFGSDVSNSAIGVFFRIIGSAIVFSFMMFFVIYGGGTVIPLLSGIFAAACVFVVIFGLFDLKKGKQWIKQ